MCNNGVWEVAVSVMELACVRKMEAGGFFLSGPEPSGLRYERWICCSAMMLSVWIVVWIIDCYIRFLWLELWMSKLSSSDVAPKFQDGQNGSISTLAFAGEATITLLMSELRTGLSFYLDIAVSTTPG
jgi:hypothetical protein